MKINDFQHAKNCRAIFDAQDRVRYSFGNRTQCTHHHHIHTPRWCSPANHLGFSRHLGDHHMLSGSKNIRGRGFKSRTGHLYFIPKITAKNPQGRLSINGKRCEAPYETKFKAVEKAAPDALEMATKAHEEREAQEKDQEVSIFLFFFSFYNALCRNYLYPVFFFCQCSVLSFGNPQLFSNLIRDSHCQAIAPF